MKHFDENMIEGEREIRNEFISKRWEQLYEISNTAGDDAIKYLFATNAGGAVAVLAYLGTLAENGVSLLSVKFALLLFFIGIVLVGIYKANQVHYNGGLFKNYQSLVKKYYDQEIGWEAMSNSDAEKVGEPIAPYLLGYASFTSFILGCLIGAYGVL